MRPVPVQMWAGEGGATTSPLPMGRERRGRVRWVACFENFGSVLATRAKSTYRMQLYLEFHSKADWALPR